MSPSTVRRYEREGRIAARRTLGGQRRFCVADLERIRANHDAGDAPQ